MSRTDNAPIDSARPDTEIPPVPGRAPASDVAGVGRVRATVFITPALLLIAVFLVFPAVWTLYLGLTNFALLGPNAAHPQFVGLSNYTMILSDPQFLRSLGLTLLFVLGSAIIGQSLLGFALAWTFSHVSKVVRSVVEFFVLLAWIIPSSVSAFLWLALLDPTQGTLNALLHTQGLGWLISYPMQSIIVFNTWAGTAFSMLLFSAALDSVPASQLETARLVGSGMFAQLRDVIFPHIRGHVLTNTLLITLWTFNVFTPYLLTAGGPDNKSNILPIYVYRLALQSGQFGEASAVSLIMILINLVIALLYLRLLRKKGER